MAILITFSVFTVVAVAMVVVRGVVAVIAVAGRGVGRLLVMGCSWPL